MAFWILTREGQIDAGAGVWWGPWLTHQQAVLMADGQPIVDEDEDGWPDPTRWLAPVVVESASERETRQMRQDLVAARIRVAELEARLARSDD